MIASYDLVKLLSSKISLAIFPENVAERLTNDSKSTFYYSSYSFTKTYIVKLRGYS